MVTSTLEEIFNRSQYSAASHNKLAHKLHTVYEKSDLHTFQEKFILYMKYALVHSEKSLSVRVLDFIAKFCGVIEGEAQNRENKENDQGGNDSNIEEDPMCPFIYAVFNELLQTHDYKNQVVRVRVCYTIKRILQSMGTEASIDSELCDKIYAGMLERLKDRSPQVRAQAVAALERLQDPSDPNCLVVKAFLFHMQMDCSAEVRRAVLICLGRSKCTLPFIRARICDVRDIVRRQAYLSLSKVSIRSHSIKDRETILDQGLKDRSDMVRDTVEKVLLPNWLENCHNNFKEFLHALDVEGSSELPDKALKVLFKQKQISELIKDLELDSDKLVPPDKLDVETAFFWRCLADHLAPEDEWELVLPELTLFCDYIKRNMAKLETKEKCHPWEIGIQEDFIMVQLLELTNVFDLADEAGRENLRQLLLHMLASNNVRFKLIPTIIKVFNKVVPDVNTRLQLVAEAVSEIHEPMMSSQTSVMSASERQQKDFKLAQLRVQKHILQDDLAIAVQEREFLKAESYKNKLAQLEEEYKEMTLQEPKDVRQATPESKEEDPCVIAKCLCIIYETVQSPSVRTFTDHLRSLMENFVSHSLQQVAHPVVQVLALQCMAAFATLNVDLAPDTMAMLCLYMASSCDEVVLVSLKGVLDLLSRYGLQAFSLEEVYERKEPQSEKPSRRHLMRHSTIIEEETDNDEEMDESRTETQNKENNEDNDSDEKPDNLFSVITGLLDKAQGQTLHCVVNGLCKLLLGTRIASPDLVSRLVLLWFNPVYEDDMHLRQLLGLFFKSYATTCPIGQEVLEQSFMPAITTVLNAPPSSPLAQVDVRKLAQFLLDLTRCGVNRHSSGVNVHNNIAIQMCNELILENFEGFTLDFLQILCYMELSLDDNQRKNLEQMITKLSQACPDRTCARAIQKFKTMVEGSQGTDDLPPEKRGSAGRAKRPSSAANSEDDSRSSDFERSKALRAGSSTMVPSVSSDITVIPESEEEENESVFEETAIM